MIEYDSITVPYAWELTSVYMCYSQGEGFNIALFKILYLYCTHGHLVLGSWLLSLSTSVLQTSGVCGYVRRHGHVLPRTTLIKIRHVH